MRTSNGTPADAHPTGGPDTSVLRLVAAVGCGWLNAWLLAGLADQSAGRPWHEVMRPFGTRAMLLVQLLAATGLAHLLSVGAMRWIRNWETHFNRGRRPLRLHWLGWLLIGIGWWLTLSLSPADRERLGLLLPVGGQRLAWILLWILPWWMVLVPGGSILSFDPSGRTRRDRLALVMAALIAVCVPGLFAAQLHEQLGRRVARYREQGRLWRAWLTLGRQDELGQQPQTTSQQLVSLGRELQVIASRVEQFQTAAAPTATIDSLPLWQHADDLAALERNQQAESVLQTKISGTNQQSDADRLLRLAELAARRAAWEEAAELCGRACRELSRTESTAVDTLPYQAAVAAHADYLRRGKRYGEAKEILAAALAEADLGAAAYHELLGEHHHLAGRPFAAHRHWQTCLQLMQQLADASPPAQGLPSPAAAGTPDYRGFWDQHIDPPPPGLPAEWLATWHQVQSRLADLHRASPACLWLASP